MEQPPSRSGNFSPATMSPTEGFPARRGTNYFSQSGPSVLQDDSERIPPNQHGDKRTIVMCFDGTLQEVGARSSNVVEMFSLLTKDEPEDRQLTYYDSGIGTTNGEGAPPSKLSKMIDAWMARTVPKHIKRGYNFLVENYHRGDKVCLFGFSRGAYIARALAGMLCKVGLLPRGSDKHKINAAYEKYANKTADGWQDSQMHQKAHIRVDIDFLGVWDTVASVGFPPTYLPFTRRNPGVRVFRHAVALDERRINFSPYLYQSEPCDPDTMTPEDQLEHDWFQEYQKRFKDARPNASVIDKNRSTKVRPTRQEVDYTDHLEVWFSGAHSDVGGSFKHKRQYSHQLGRIPLFWMIRQCFLARTGIQIEVSKLAALAFPPDDEEGFPADILFPEVMSLPQSPKLDHAHIIESLIHEYFERDEHSNLTDTLVEKYTTPPLDLPLSLLNTPQSGITNTSNAFTRLYQIVRYEIEHALKGTVNDAVQKKAFWRLVEQMPIMTQAHEGTSRNVLRRNRGRGRIIRYRDGKHIKVHYTVAMRMHGPPAPKPYVPKAQYDAHDKSFPQEGVQWMEWHHEPTTGSMYSRMVSKLRNSA